MVPTAFKDEYWPITLEEHWQVDANGCWIWRGAPDSWGYGRKLVCGKVNIAHRWVWQQLRGEIPVGKELDHLCKVKLCVNPDHLEPVSTRENQRRAGNCKLTEQQVREIRDFYQLGSMSVNGLAKRYRISQKHARAIIHRRSWRDL